MENVADIIYKVNYYWCYEADNRLKPDKEPLYSGEIHFLKALLNKLYQRLPTWNFPALYPGTY